MSAHACDSLLQNSQTRLQDRQYTDYYNQTNQWTVAIITDCHSAYYILRMIFMNMGKILSIVLEYVGTFFSSKLKC